MARRPSAVPVLSRRSRHVDFLAEAALIGWATIALALDATVVRLLRATACSATPRRTLPTL